MGGPLELPSWRITRDLDAGGYLESFLVSAIVAVLGIRVYLEMTGYPKLGGHGLHIAHMLWGGVLMVVAIVLLLGFLGKRVQRVSAIVGGFGWGTFIDELGKFITSDNNYFFEPTIALIYVIFILMFLSFRALERRQQLTDTEYLANALAFIQEALISKVDTQQRGRALVLLDQVKPGNRLAGVVRQALQLVECLPPPQPNLAERLMQAAHKGYERAISSTGFRGLVLFVFLFHAALVLTEAVILIVDDPRFTITTPAIDWVDVGAAFSSILSAVMVVIGGVALRWSRLAAYVWFRRATIVSIFLVQFFSFYTEQLSAIVGLMIDVPLLIGLNYLIGEEMRTATTRLAARAPR